MNIVILDDYQDAVRKLNCASKLENYHAKVYTNTVKGLGQLSLRLKDADVIVLIRGRTQVNRQLIEKLPKLKMISQTGRVGSHLDVQACTERGIAVAEGMGSPIAPAELTWALILAAMRRLPQYISNLKHGVWQQSGLKTGSMPPNFGLGNVLHGKTLGIWGYGKVGQLVAGFGRAFGMKVVVWGGLSSMEKAQQDGHSAAISREAFFRESDVLSLHLKLTDETREIIKVNDLAEMKPSSLLVNTSHAELIEAKAVDRARNSIKGLLDMAPEEALVDVAAPSAVPAGRDRHVISSTQQTCWSVVMPRQSGDGWFLKYESAKASTRLLLSLPQPMLDDAHAAAKAQGISVAELARRAMTHHMSELARAHPELKLIGQGP